MRRKADPPMTGGMSSLFAEVIRDACEYAELSLTDEELKTASVDLLKRAMDFDKDGQSFYSGALVAACILRAKGVK